MRQHEIGSVKTHRAAMAALVMMLALVAMPLSAQEESAMQPPPTTAVNPSGVPLGPFLFTPSLEAIFMHKDNIYLTPDHEVDDNVWVVRPRLMLELPVYQNYLRLVYVPEYREYMDNSDVLEENISHFLDADFYLDSASGVEFNVRNRFVMSSLAVPEVDPGRELVFGNEPFTKDDFEAEMRWFFTETDGLGVNFRYYTLSYDDSDDAFFYDYDGYVAGLSYNRQMTALARLYVQYNRLENSVDNTFDFRGYSGNQVRVGINGELAPTLAAKFYAGYEDRSFDGDDGVDRDFKDFILNGGIDWTLSPMQSLQVNLGYLPHQSNFADAAYYRGKRAELSYNIGFAETVYASIGGFYQMNDYPDEVILDREDDLWRLNLAVGLHLTDFLSVRAQVRREERDSNLDQYDYEANTYMFNVILGY